MSEDQPMAKTITQSATFPASPKTLYRMFLGSKEHSAATGGKARIAPRVGGKFTAWGGSLWGRTLLLKPGKMIVQSWRSSSFNSDDPDSVLVLSFSGDAKQGKISMVHVNVPDHDAQGVKEGWVAYYWKPWSVYLAKLEQGAKGGKKPR
jgi:activator of HSP90 ATPase